MVDISPPEKSFEKFYTDHTDKNSCEFADFIRDKTLNAFKN